METTQTRRNFACTTCRRRKLKCDGAKPSCTTCNRLNHQCEYVIPQRKGPYKRRNMKDLEARLNELETALAAKVAATSSNASSSADAATNSDSYPSMNVESQIHMEEMDLSMHDDFLGTEDQSPTISIQSSGDKSQSPGWPRSEGEVVPLGLDEPLPPEGIIDKLHEIYFNRIHKSLPILHKQRYLSALKLPFHLAPAVCLRYAIWALAATVSGTYAEFETVFYERAREYAQADEMKDSGQSLGTLDHIRFWILIGEYECRNAYFHRYWSSGGRAGRLAQMIGLHRLDEDEEEGNSPYRTLSNSECIDFEERRRLFWACFCTDRNSSIVTGWPLFFQEEDILTNLPVSEYAFEQGEMQTTTSLSAVLDNEISSEISPFAGFVIVAAFCGQLVIHLHRPNRQNRFQDVVHGEYWKRHRKLDSVLSNLVVLLPSHLKVGKDGENESVRFLRIAMYSLVIALHQAAVVKAEKYDLDENVMRQSQSRSDAAAEEVIRSIRHASPGEIEAMPPIVAFCLHMTVGSLVRSGKDPLHEYQSRRNFEILLHVLRTAKRITATLQYVIQAIENSLQGIPESNATLPPSQRFQEKHAAIEPMESPQTERSGNFDPLPEDGPSIPTDIRTSISSESSSLPTRSYEKFQRQPHDSSPQQFLMNQTRNQSAPQPIPINISTEIPADNDTFNSISMSFEPNQGQQSQHTSQMIATQSQTLPHRTQSHDPCQHYQNFLDPATWNENHGLAMDPNDNMNFLVGETLAPGILEEILAWEGPGQ